MPMMFMLMSFLNLASATMRQVPGVVLLRSSSNSPRFSSSCIIVRRDTVGLGVSPPLSSLEVSLKATWKEAVLLRTVSVDLKLGVQT